MMALEDTIKKEFFSRPRVSKIIGEKKFVPRVGALVDLVESLQDCEYIELDYDIIPLTDKDGTRVYENGQNFLKRGPKVELPRPGSRRQAMIDRHEPWKYRESAFNKDSLGELNNSLGYAGYGWWGIRDNSHKSVHLVDCIKGAKLFAFCKTNTSSRNRIKMVEYSDIENIEGYGGKALVSVPSRTTTKRYDVLMESLPVGGIEDYANIWDIRHNHNCKMTATGFSFRYKGREDYFCPHVIAAYIELMSRGWHSESNRRFAAMNPFALPDENTTDYYRKLHNNVVVKFQGLPRRWLNKAEEERLLWDFVKKYGNSHLGKHKTFYSSGKKFVDYNW